jgi:ankyrin repeat protein
MLFAARMGDVETARMLLEAGADVNDAPNGPSALVVATVRGHVPLALLLLKHGADPNHACSGYTALHWAAGSWETTLTGRGGIELPGPEDPEHAEWRVLRGLREGKLDLVKALLFHGANPNVRLETEPTRTGYTKSRPESRTLIGATPFLLAAQAGDVAVMKLLAAAGADPSLATTRDTKNADIYGSIRGGGGGGMTPLMAAAGLGRVITETLVTAEMSFEAAKLALELGNDINATNDYGETALHGAAHTRNNALVQFLVDNGARVNVKTTRAFALAQGPAGQTPENYAERYISQASLPIYERTSTGDLLRKLAAAGVP